MTKLVRHCLDLIKTAFAIIGLIAMVAFVHNLLVRAYSTECINVEDETNVTTRL